MLKRTIALCCLAALLLVAAGCKQKSEKRAPEEEGLRGINVGQFLPPYSTKGLDGSAIDLTKERGNVVFLNIWATWCPPCRYEIPELQKLHDSYAARKFKVIGVSVDEGGEENVRQFVAAQKMTYPVAVDAEGKVATLLETSVLPTSVLLDRHGRIAWKKYGIVDTADPVLIGALESALRQK